MCRLIEVLLVKLFVDIAVIECCGQTCADSSPECYQDMIIRFVKEQANWREPPNYGEAFQVEDSSTPEQWGKFDYIIVGAGVSGSVIASRLSEDPKISVLVLEAGPWAGQITDIPGMIRATMASQYNWGFRSTPGTSAFLGLREKKCNCPRGKAVGGSSVINAMIYSRPNPGDFFKWALQCPKWNYVNVLQYFKKIENASMSDVSSAFHGRKGPLHVEYGRYNASMIETFIRANEEMGRSRLDYNGIDQLGFSHIQLTTDNGRRVSAAKAYLTKDVRQRKDLQILDLTLATRILITDKVARGVEFVHNKRLYHATAKREVIVSGGAFNTPQLLMLSGIGLRKQLENHNISCIQDLKVGQQLHDHPSYFLLYFSTKMSVASEPLIEQIRNYLEGFGSLTVGTISAIGFVQYQWKWHRSPGIEYVLSFGLLGPQNADVFDRTFAVTSENYDAVLKPLEGTFAWSVRPILQHQKSVGSVKLQSKSPTDFPSIDLNYYSPFRVYGVDRLRVADASVIPTTLSGHHQATCYVIGEMAAEYIKNRS